MSSHSRCPRCRFLRSNAAAELLQSCLLCLCRFLRCLQLPSRLRQGFLSTPKQVLGLGFIGVRRMAPFQNWILHLNSIPRHTKQSFCHAHHGIQKLWMCSESCQKNKHFWGLEPGAVGNKSVTTDYSDYLRHDNCVSWASCCASTAPGDQVSVFSPKSVTECQVSQKFVEIKIMFFTSMCKNIIYISTRIKSTLHKASFWKIRCY